jgi:hypothetical protein
VNAGPSSSAAAKISALVARDAGLRFSENCAMICPVRCASVMRLHNKRGQGVTVPSQAQSQSACQPPAHFTFVRWNFFRVAGLEPRKPGSKRSRRGIRLMSLGTTLMILLILVLLGVIQSWGYSDLIALGRI